MNNRCKSGLSLVSLVLILSMLLVGCGSSNSSTPPASAPATSSAAEPASTAASVSDGETHDPFSIEIYSFSSGSFTYIFAVAWAEMINKYSDWLKATAVESPGNNQNGLMMMNQPEKRANTIYFTIPYYAQRGLYQFEGMQNTRSKEICNLSLAVQGFVTADSKYKTLQDLVDQTMLVLPNNPTTNYYEAVMKQVESTLKFEGMDGAQAMEMVLNGRAAAYQFAGFPLSADFKTWMGNPTGVEFLTRAKDVSFVSVPRDLANELKSEKGGNFEDFYMSTVTIPAGGIGDPRQTEPWTCFVNGTPFCADEDMDPDVVYEALRILGEHYTELLSYNPQAAVVTPETLSMTMSGMEMHPGAMKYWNEIGITPKLLDDFLVEAGV